MMRPEVEFVDPPVYAPTDAPPPPTRTARLRANALYVGGPLLGWSAAAAFCVAAPFRLVYSASYQAPDGTGQRFSVDGWGRTPVIGGEPTFGAHGVRIGAAFVATAVVLAVLVVVAAWRGLRRTHATRPGIAIAAHAVAPPCILAGLSSATWLMIDGAFSQYRAANRQAAQLGANPASGDVASPQPTIHMAVGPALWLALAAAVCATAATVLYLWPRDVVDATPGPLGSIPAESVDDPEYAARLEGAELLD